MKIRRPSSVFIFLILAANSFLSANPKFELIEASGIMRLGKNLLAVDDSVDGGYFRIPLGKIPGKLINLREDATQFVTLPAGTLAMDLEGIDVLADGRIIVLSERLRSLIDAHGVVAVFPGRIGEFGGRGLEGVAVLPLPDGNSRIAVVWEGGYPELLGMPQQLRGTVGGKALKPVLYVHDLKRGSRKVILNPRDSFSMAELDVPVPSGQEPAAQRFRAPDLVWCNLSKANENEWGFIVLLTSQNNLDPHEYEYHWLQRFTKQGKRVGDPLDLAKFLPPDVQQSNWEGLSWFEEGKSLVLAHEGSLLLAPHAFILKLPPEWEFAPRNGNRP